MKPGEQAQKEEEQDQPVKLGEQPKEGDPGYAGKTDEWLLLAQKQSFSSVYPA